MLKSLRIPFALLAMTAALAAPAYPQESARPQESPWAMRAPAAVPHGAPTLSAQQRAAQEAAERGRRISRRSRARLQTPCRRKISER